MRPVAGLRGTAMVTKGGSVEADLAEGLADVEAGVPKPAKNRIHLDLIPPGDDQQAELARLTGLGASVRDDQPPGVSWVVLADPEGNEFCLEG